MKLFVLVLAILATALFAGMAGAADIVAPSASGPQWKAWNPSSSSDLGSPVFKPVQGNHMTLYYGFRGAVVHDKATNRWERVRMVTVTRSKVEGFVNQVNNSFALAAGLHEIAVYDFGKHAWFLCKNATPDDSTGMLQKNFVLGPDFVMVKILNGPFMKYTSASGWQKVR